MRTSTRLCCTSTSTWDDCSSLKFLVAFCYCVVAFDLLSVNKWTVFPPVLRSGDVENNISHKFHGGRLGCQSWQSCAADFWAVSSKRTLLTKVLFGRCAANLVRPTSSSWGVAGAFQHGSLDHAQKAANDALKTLPGANLLKAEKTWRVLGGLTDGFVGRFCGGFLGLAGGFWGDRASADFLFSAGGFSGGFFRRILLLYVWPRNHRKHTTSMAAFRKIFHGRLKPRSTVSKFQPTFPEIGIRSICPLFWPRLGTPGAWRPHLWNSASQAQFLDGWARRWMVKENSGRKKNSGRALNQWIAGSSFPCFRSRNFRHGQKHSKEKWTACPPVGLGTTIVRRFDLCFWRTGQKIGKSMERISSFLGSDVSQKWQPTKKDTSLFTIRWAAKLRPKDGWRFLLFLRWSSATKLANVFPWLKKKLREWKTFPPFHTRVSGHGYLLTRKFQSDCFSA